MALSSRQIGELFAQVRLPKITGFLVTGLLIGPHLLRLLDQTAIGQLSFINDIALAFIAFAAGSELYLPELRGHWRSLNLVTAGLVVATLLIGGGAVFLLADRIPFMAPLDGQGRAAAALLAGTILVARSPSSAIAIVNELRAKGPFTQLALGVTVIMDIVVISLFAVATSLAEVLLAGERLNAIFLAQLAIEIGLAIGGGLMLYRVLDTVLQTRWGATAKITLIVVSGYAVFVIAHRIHGLSLGTLPLVIRFEPLLVCLVAAFLVNNRSTARAEFGRLLSDWGLPIYVSFFTLTGASLELDIFVATWPIALALFSARVVAIVVGAFGGGALAGDPMPYNRLKWMAFITQAGVALGLAQETAEAFPSLGHAFATMIISVVVVNETVGPLLFKWAINRVGEAHTRAPSAAFDGQNDALIFGYDNQSLALARQLMAHDWQVRLVVRSVLEAERLAESTLPVRVMVEPSAAALRDFGAARADAIVAMFNDDDANLAVLEIAYETFGTRNLVVRLNESQNVGRFHELGALIVDPRTAMVNLLDQFVRAPAATSLLFGLVADEEIGDIVISDPAFDGVYLRDLGLPQDVLLVAIKRDASYLITHGYTRLRLGDEVTVVGPPDQVDRVAIKLQAVRSAPRSADA